MTGIARLNDETIGTCRYHGPNIKGKIITASTDTNCNDRGVARIGDEALAECGHSGFIVTSSSVNFVNGRGIARLNDTTDGDYVATIITASEDSYSDELG